MTLDQIIFSLAALVFGTPLLLTLMAAVVGARALYEPRLSVVAYAFSLLTAAIAGGTLAMALSLLEGEGDRWLFPLTYGGAGGAFLVSALCLFAAGRELRSTRSAGAWWVGGLIYGLALLAPVALGLFLE